MTFKEVSQKEIRHIAIDSTGLKVFGEGEWKVKELGVSSIWQFMWTHTKS